MPIELHNRPLRAITRDRSLWVDREADTSILKRSVSLRFNTLVLGEPGVGVTSLVNFVAGDLEDAGRRVVRVSARRSMSPERLLAQVAQVLSDGPMALSRTDDAVQNSLRELASAADAQPDALVVVDDVSGRLGHETFGRLRDELWELGLQWFVTARVQEEPLLLAPPADAFFETVHHVRALSLDALEELLDRRDPDGELSPDVRTLVAGASGGRPGRALELARRALVVGSPEDLGRTTLVERVVEQLGEPAGRLIDELIHAGPTGPSDEQLLARLGWSAPRAYQVFGELEDAGFIAASPEHTGRPGRPRRLFRLTEPL